MPAAHALVLRPATLADAGPLAALGRESFVAKFGALYREADLSTFLAQTYATDVVSSEVINPRRRVQLAYRGDRLVGYCKIGLDCGYPNHARGRSVMELKQLYTAPDAVGGGIGAALMDWAMAEFTGQHADEVQLSVYSENVGAQRFYARYGFVKVADISFRVGEHVDAEFLLARLL